MINVLQIITHMPLLSLKFPDTTRFVYSLIISISSFDVLPVEKIEGRIFNFRDNDTMLNDTNFNELDIFLNDHKAFFQYFFPLTRMFTLRNHSSYL